MIIDDILIYGRNVKEHDERVIQGVKDAGIKVNRDKCEFLKSEIRVFRTWFLEIRCSAES